MKQCTNCKKYLPTSRFGTRSWTRKDGTKKTIPRSQCRACISGKNLVRFHNNPSTKEAHKRASYKSRLKSYGLTPEEYEELLKSQDGKCYVCKDDETLFIDHCHETGRVRKLLCNNCNAALGMVKEKIPILEGLIEYIKEHN